MNMDIDSFGEIMDKFLKENDIKMLIEMPKGTLKAEVRNNYEMPGCRCRNDTKRVNEVSYVDDKRYVLEHIDRRTLLEQLAEEAAELSQAALKLIRAEKLSDNPTPANVSIASEQLNEELADVLVAADAVGIPVLESCDNSKWRRWAARIRKEREM